MNSSQRGWLFVFSQYQLPFVGYGFSAAFWWWGYLTSTESLILAQDERWRRA